MSQAMTIHPWIFSKFSKLMFGLLKQVPPWRMPRCYFNLCWIDIDVTFTLCYSDVSPNFFLKTLSSLDHLTIWIFGRSAIIGSAVSRLNTFWWTETSIAVAVTKAVTDPVTSAIIRTSSGTARNRFSKIIDRHAFLINAHFSRCAFCTIRRESWIYLIQSEIHHRRTTRNYRTTVVYKRMTQYRHRFHTEF